MVSMARLCTIGSQPPTVTHQNDSLPTDLDTAALTGSETSAEVGRSYQYFSGCCNGETRTESDDFFAPTGKGTSVTRVLCATCGRQLSETREYYD